MAITSHSFWVFRDNFMAALLGLAHIAAYNLDKDESNLILHEISRTSNDNDVWYDYPFIGRHKLQLYFSYDEENADIIFIKVVFEQLLKPEIDLCIFFTQEFNLSLKKPPDPS